MDINEFASTPFGTDFPEALRRYLGLQSLEDLVYGSNADGATRLFLCPSYEPIEAMTLTFFEREAIASLVASDDDVWERIACGEAPADDAAFVPRERILAIRDLPSLMQGWRSIADAMKNAESCASDNPDLISFYHLAFGNGVDSLHMWFNPRKEANPNQFRLLDGYVQIKARL